MRLIDADKIMYSWQIDADGTEHDGVTLESVVDKISTEEAIPLSVIEDIKAEIKKNILDELPENGTNAEISCYDSGLLRCLEIIDKHISGKER